MTEYKKYLEYKKSNIPGISLIPAHWDSVKIHQIASFNNESLSESTDPEKKIRYIEISDVSSDEGISFHQPILFKDAPSRARRVVNKGDILISTVRTYLRAVYGVEAGFDNIIASTGFAVVRPVKCNGNFLRYALLSDPFLDEVISSSTGVSYPAIKTSLLSSLKIPLPSLDEQIKIARFLEEETYKINLSIAHMESLIALLTEKRAALVSETVTRGIPGEHTEFKDSGVDWLGEIPASWDIAKVRDFFTERREKNDLGQKANYLSLMANRGVIPYAEKGNIGNKMPEDLSNTKKIFRGDFVINSMNYGIGSFGDSSYDGVCSSVYVVLTPQPKVYNKFAYLLLSNMDVAKYAQSFGKGILAHRCAIGWDILRCLGMPLPPEKEQYKIVDFLNTETQKIDKTISSVKSSIKLLKEKRQVLISDVVTGKIDVSNEVN